MTEADPRRMRSRRGFLHTKTKLYKKILLFSLKYVAKAKLIV